MRKEVIFTLISLLVMYALYVSTRPAYAYNPVSYIDPQNKDTINEGSQPSSNTTYILLNMTTNSYAQVGEVDYSSYSYDLSHLIFQYARTSYCNITDITDWTCHTCEQIPQLQEMATMTNSTLSIQGFCGYDSVNNFNIIAFRGSVDQSNFKTDMEYTKEAVNFCEGCKVHHGIYEIYLNIQPEVLQCAQKLKSQYPEAEFVVTGHSLGAALSSFAALDVQQQVSSLSFYYNFGSPRLGNQAFVDYWNDQFKDAFVSRVVHWKDPVPHLPSTLQGFANFKTEIFYDQSFTRYTECDEKNWDNCSNQFFNPFSLSIEDHLYYYNECAGCTLDACQGILQTYGSYNPFSQYQSAPQTLNNFLPTE